MDLKPCLSHLATSLLSKILFSFALAFTFINVNAQDIPYLSLTMMRSDNASDETIIAFADGATSAYDVDWDAVKFYGGGINLVSYAQNDTTGLAINFFAPFTDSISVKLGMFPSQNGTYTFNLQNQSSFTSTKILLKDAYLNTTQDITNATSVTFSVSSDPATRNNRFYVVFKHISAPPINLAPAASNLSVSGTAKVGYTLHANYTYTDAEGDAQGSSILSWLRNGVAISGANLTTYTLTTGDLGSTIAFEVTPVAVSGTLTGTKVVSASTSAVAAQSAPVANNLSIAGATKVGSTLQAVYTYTDADGDLQGTSTFTWLRNGITIPGATSASYVLTVADYGATIKFDITPVSATGNPNTGTKAVSAATSAIAANPHVVFSTTTVSKVSTKAQINWNTSSELYNSYFVVERSTSATTGFASVSSNIAGYASSSTTKSYSFTDPNTKKGTYYYRIKAVSQFNTVIYSNVVSLVL